MKNSYNFAMSLIIKNFSDGKIRPADTLTVVFGEPGSTCFCVAVIVPKM
jgi:hypothetical protein